MRLRLGKVEPTDEHRIPYHYWICMPHTLLQLLRSPKTSQAMNQTDLFGNSIPAQQGLFKSRRCVKIAYKKTTVTAARIWARPPPC